MVEKSKAKKAKTISKKTSTKSRKSEIVQEVEEVVASPVLKRAKIGKILSQSKTQDELTQEEPELIEKVEAERPPLERKFFTSEAFVNSEVKISDNNIQAAIKPQLDNGELLQVRLSRSLTRKLREQAADEGIGLDEFLTELLSESVVLRAWEIVERKNQMKSGQPMGNSRNNHSGGGSQQQNRSHNSINSNQRPNNNKSNGHRGMNHSRYQNIMEDKATFLEYVRSQERNRR